MPVSVIVGGQFGSEGKGKVALRTAIDRKARAVVRVGGTNSGHTAFDESGKRWALRQLPVSVLAPNAIAVLPPGALIDPAIFLEEVAQLELGPERVFVSPFASVITGEDKAAEQQAGLTKTIGSTGSGTGAALLRRIGRMNDSVLARECVLLQPFLHETDVFLGKLLAERERVVIEGSQGFGLSLLHGGYYPKATSRDTTAAGFLSETGLSPFEVDDIALVIRSFPIRVAGDSGKLTGETSWSEIARNSGLPSDYHELTTATKKVRRVGRFDAELVRRAIAANKPNRIILNHFDYVDDRIRNGEFSQAALDFIEKNVEAAIGQSVDQVGIGPNTLLDRNEVKFSMFGGKIN